VTAELLRPPTLPRLALRGPLAAWAQRFAALPPGLGAVEDATQQQLGLRLDPASPGARAVEALLGAPLPTTASTCAAADGVDVVWLGPDEWLVLSRAPLPVVALREAVAASGGTVVDVSAQRTTLRLSGALVPDLLAGGCPVDLHPSVFGPGTAVQTSIAQIGVVLLARSPGGTDVTLLVRASFAGALADWILDAAVELTPTDRDRTTDGQERP
jgi:sarcosine oxidase subunit gamma